MHGSPTHRALRWIFGFTVAALVSAPAPDVFARDAAEVDLVRRAITEVASRPKAASSRSAADTRDDVSALLDRYVDLAAFDALVFADVGSQLSPGQKKALSQSFRALLVSRIAARLVRAPSAQPRIDPPRVENGETRLRLVYLATTTGAPDDVEVDLAFAKRAGPPRIVDVTIAGANFSKNLRASVNKVFRRDGYDGLLARLDKLRDAGPGPHKSSDLTL